MLPYRLNDLCACACTHQAKILRLAQRRSALLDLVLMRCLATPMRRLGAPAERREGIQVGVCGVSGAESVGSIYSRTSTSEKNAALPAFRVYDVGVTSA